MMPTTLVTLLIYSVPIILFLCFLVEAIRYMRKKIELQTIQIEQTDKFIALYKKVNNVQENSPNQPEGREDGWQA